MKYRDLVAVADIACVEMSSVVGGISFGEFISGRIQSNNEGFAHQPGVLNAQAATGTSNLGELIQYRSDQYGNPGINGIVALQNDLNNADINVPPGLPPGN